MRADLEFYLPQLICQFLRSDLSDHEEKELVSFILKAFDLNLFFAHKVWFFLEASKINKDSSHQIKKIFSLQKQLENLVEKSHEEIYLPNSVAVLKLLKMGQI